MTAAERRARVHAFDDTDWWTMKELRNRCLQQVQGALMSDQEEVLEWERELPAGNVRDNNPGPSLGSATPALSPAPDRPSSATLFRRAPEKIGIFSWCVQ
jgi:hypothetical protein